MHRFLLLISLMLAAAAVAAPMAMATRAEERQGAALVRDFQAGDQTCSSLSAKQFELIGEYEMSRIIGDPTTHDAMNERLSQMMGPKGEAQAHVFLAQRRLGCADGARPPASFGRMMGVVGSHRGGGMDSGIMGGNGNGTNAGGYNNGGSGMMSSQNDGGWGAGTIILVVLLCGALATALIVGLMRVSRRSDPPA